MNRKKGAKKRFTPYDGRSRVEVLLRNAVVPRDTAVGLVESSPEYGNSMLENRWVPDATRRAVSDVLMSRSHLPESTATLIAITATSAEELHALARTGENRVEPLWYILHSDHVDDNVVDVVLRRRLPKTLGQAIADSLHVDDRVRVHALRDVVDDARSSAAKAVADPAFLEEILATSCNSNGVYSERLAGIVLRRRPDLAPLVAESVGSVEPAAGFRLPVTSQWAILKRGLRRVTKSGPTKTVRATYMFTDNHLARTLASLAIRPDTHPDVRATIRGIAAQGDIYGHGAAELQRIMGRPELPQGGPEHLDEQQIGVLLEQLDEGLPLEMPPELTVVVLGAELLANPRLNDTHRRWLRMIMKRVKGPGTKATASVVAEAAADGTRMDLDGVWDMLASVRQGSPRQTAGLGRTSRPEGDPGRGRDLRVPGTYAPKTTTDPYRGERVTDEDILGAHVASYLRQRLGDDAALWTVALDVLATNDQPMVGEDLAAATLAVAG